MRLLLDANLSSRIVQLLDDAGYEAIHVDDIGLLRAADSEIIDQARADGLVVVTADSDFPMLLAISRDTSPSVIHLRHVAELTPDHHATLLSLNLPIVAASIARGAIVSLIPTRLAIRELPVH